MTDAPRRTAVLFVCGQNSARSRMAAAFLNHLDGERFTAYSAGVAASPANPLAAAAMAERGLDITAGPPRTVAQAVADLSAKEHRSFDAVIMVCDAAAGLCPAIPGARVTERWSFADPAAASGNAGERLRLARRVRDEIETAVRAWIAGCKPEENA